MKNANKKKKISVGFIFTFSSADLKGLREQVHLSKT